LIDEENDPVPVANYCTACSSYGNGNTVQAPVFSPNIQQSVEYAVGMRPGQATFNFVYEWTNNDDGRQREFIDTGGNGIISDLDSGSLGHLVRVVE
jgi:hypothetical protein